MAIEIRYDPSYSLIGAAAAGYGATQRAERDRAFAAQVQESNARLQLQYLNLQQQAQDSYRDDYLRYIQMGVQNEQYYAGLGSDNQRFYDNLYSTNYRDTRQDQRMRELAYMDDQRQRQMQVAGFDQQQRMTGIQQQGDLQRDYLNDQRRMEQAQYGVEANRQQDQQQQQYRLDLSRQNAEQQRERDLMGMRAQMGMNPIPWNQRDEQELSGLQSAYQRMQNDATFTRDQRQQALAQIEQRMQPLMQRQQEAQQFSIQQRSEAWNRERQMRTVYWDPQTSQITNQPGPGRQPYILDDNWNPRAMFEAPSGGGQQQGPIPGITSQQRATMANTVRGETAMNEETGVQSPRFRNEFEVQREADRRLISNRNAALGINTEEGSNLTRYIEDLAKNARPRNGMIANQPGEGNLDSGAQQALNRLAENAALSNGLLVPQALPPDRLSEVRADMATLLEKAPAIAAQIDRQIDQASRSQAPQQAAQAAPQQQQQPPAAQQSNFDQFWQSLPPDQQMQLQQAFGGQRPQQPAPQQAPQPQQQAAAGAQPQQAAPAQAQQRWEAFSAAGHSAQPRELESLLRDIEQNRDYFVRLWGGQRSYDNRVALLRELIEANRRALQGARTSHGSHPTRQEMERGRVASEQERRYRETQQRQHGFRPTY